MLVAIFVVGYLAIVFEHALGVNKSAAALLTGVACWIVVGGELSHLMGELSQILFFLLGAMTVVELIDAHDGFGLITSRITSRSRRKLVVTIAIVAFLFSAVLDNLTTSIVMMSLVRKLASDERDRMYLGSMVIIAANAGGAWSPIGDVTTTMLWVGGQITTKHLVLGTLIPSLVSAVVPLAWIAWRLRGEVERPPPATTEPAPYRALVLVSGIVVLLGVPVFKVVTGLPPFMGVLLGVGLLWVLTERIGTQHSIVTVLQRIDTQSILFFLGILLAVGALAQDGKLAALAAELDRAIGNVDVITIAIGLSSAIVDNVPLVAAAQGMYPPTTFPQDHAFWIFLAYCAGTGGSILIIGSAAGIAVMGIQQISFGWYLKRISLPALVGYLAGALAYLGMSQLGL